MAGLLSRAGAYNQRVLLGHVLALALAAAPPDLSAVGIVMSARAEARTALLQSGGRTRVVAIGDTAFGGRVAAIESDHVAVDFDSGRVRLRLVAGAGTPSAIATTASPAVAADPAMPSLAMERREIERRLGEESGRILAETTLVPAMDAGRVAGFTITRMPDSTVLTDAGLRAGDVLTEVNGVPIDSLATLIGLWPRLQTESALRAVVLRNGQPVSLSVTLR
jgi:general secretion pathway protein C